MNETNYKSPLRLIENEWEALTSSEKSLCTIYRRQLTSGMKIRSELIMAINDIHEKYPDFHMGCIPCALAASKQDESLKDLA